MSDISNGGNEKYDIKIDMSVKNNSATKILERVRPNTTVLEFGPAYGAMTRYMKEALGCQVYIVEIDGLLFDKAMKYAVDGVCGNASDSEWLEKFASKQFDYILFSDVLEHLYDPDVVLKHAVSLLKDDGRVLLSVPNIAHSSIIIELLQNKFEYKQYGLLDNTHIRFFTYHSLIELINSAGLVTTLEDATYLQPFQTEFGNEYSDAINSSDMLRKKYFGNVYQFVFEMVKKEYFEIHRNGVDIEKKITHNSLFSSMLANIFVDTGSGYNETERTSVPYSSVYKFYYQTNVTPYTKCIRFDPVEGMPCIVENMKVVSDRGSLEAVNLNGYSASGYHMFITKDSQFDIKIPQGVSWLSIEANVYPCSEPVMPGFFAGIKKTIEQKDAELAQTSMALAEKDAELAQTSTALAEKDAKLAQTSTALAEKDAELAQTSMALAEKDMHLAGKDAVIQQKDADIVNKQHELDIAHLQYQEIQSAFWWRITKPARLLTGGVKWMLKHFPLTRAMYRSLYRLRYGSAEDSVKSDNDKTNSGNPEDTDIAEWLSENFLETDFPHGVDYKYSGVIDIVVPVYNGFDYLEALFSSIAKTEMDYRLYIVDDCSTDERVKPYLRNMAESLDNVILMENKTNLGFVKSVNRALKKAKNHVALLNTDIVLPDRWLERLMYPIIHMDKIASTTPFTNSGTICSFFNFGEDNPLFEGLSLDQIDRVFSKVKPSYIPIPTGVGFCMGMSKDVIKEIGRFDHKTFTRGYGEENDWCQRAIKAGYKNVLVDNLFVHHKHGGSFSEEEKLFQTNRNLELLNKKHPGYDADVALHFDDNPARHIRDIAAMQLISANISAKQILVFNHGWGGGSTMYLDRRIKTELSNGHNVITIRSDISSNSYLLIYQAMNYCFTYRFSEMAKLRSILLHFPCAEIYVNGLVTYPDIHGALDIIIALRNGMGVKLVFFLHDYHCVCPSIQLLNHNNEYCGVPEAENCADCFAKVATSEEYNDVQTWRKHWGMLFDSCDEIIAFSDSSLKIFEAAHGSWYNTVVVPHQVDYMPKLEKPHKATDTINIGILGAIGVPKGSHIVREMLSIIERESLNVRIIIIGYTDGTIPHSPYLFVTGEYKQHDVPALVHKYDIDIFFIPSIWPETFSYTTEEVIKMGMPIACFNLGAPAERVGMYDKGVIIDEIDSSCTLTKILKFLEDKQ